jgi:hypothetical protein
MVKNKFISIVSTLIIRFHCSVLKLTPSSWEDEFDHFLKYGSHSKNFYANFMENRDEETKETIVKLTATKKKGVACGTEEEKQEAAQDVAWSF